MAQRLNKYKTLCAQWVYILEIFLHHLSTHVHSVHVGKIP